MSDRTTVRSRRLQARIRRVAYLMWEAAGQQHGRSLEYWLAAEQEVLAGISAAEMQITAASARDDVAIPQHDEAITALGGPEGEAGIVVSSPPNDAGDDARPDTTAAATAKS